MPGTVLKRRRLVNRGRRRQMSDKQIRIFGTKKQKAQLKRRLAARRYRAHNRGGGLFSRARRAVSGTFRTLGRRRRRRPNVGEILTVLPAANRGRRRRNRGTMARAVNRRRRRLTNRRRHNRRPRLFNRRRRSPIMNRRRRRHNRRSLMNPRVVVRYRNRRHNRRHNRRRNQGIIGGDLAPALGVIGGAYVTGLVAGYLPSNLTTGALGYLTTGVVAIAQGQIVGKMFKKPQFGKWMTIGGFVVVALKMAADFFPSLNLPFALSSGHSGMGLITSSNFYVPQSNIPGSMATFVTPAGITAALPVAAAGGKLSGLGQHVMTGGLRTMRRVGRLR